MVDPEGMTRSEASEVRNNWKAGCYGLSTPTEVPRELEGQGTGSRLVRAALDNVRAQGLQVIPMYVFVASYTRAQSGCKTGSLDP